MPPLLKTEFLRGTWVFYYTIITTWYDYYTLNTIDTNDPNSQGGYDIYGSDEYGNLVVASYWPEDQYWTLFDSGIIIDQFFVFYTDGSSRLLTIVVTIKFRKKLANGLLAMS